VEVDLAAVLHNVRAVLHLVAPAGLLAVVKANAYGHGAAAVAQAAQEAGADGLAVACLREGEQLRQAGLTGPILLLSAGSVEEARAVVAHDLTQTVCRREVAEALSAAAQEAGRTAQVHLKLDTGMGRLGAPAEAVLELAQAVYALPGVEVTGVFSHLATAEDPDPTYARAQFACYQEALRVLGAHGFASGRRHLANSAAALRFPEMRLEAVRTGLLIYGLDPVPGQEVVPLRPALSWKTRVAFARVCAAGCSVSYARTYVTTRECLVGVLPLGYADGFPRAASNRAQVLVRGQLCPVIGTVCMDHVMVDLSPAGEVAVGEEVVLIGEQRGRRITANQLAEWAGTVVHEIPTRIGARVGRCYEGKIGPIRETTATVGGPMTRGEKE
jgi:alanine racemase